MERLFIIRAKDSLSKELLTLAGQHFIEAASEVVSERELKDHPSDQRFFVDCRPEEPEKQVTDPGGVWLTKKGEIPPRMRLLTHLESLPGVHRFSEAMLHAVENSCVDIAARLRR